MFDGLSGVELVMPPRRSDIDNPAMYTISEVVESGAPSYITNYVEKSSSVIEGM